jgi:NAD(P)-dependent dehydrogenase (short-subunit alcohol dehydrogenase family)
LELKKFVVAKYGAEVVILAGRKQDALDDPMKKKDETPSANLRSLILDLASLESAKKAAAEVHAYVELNNVLINNAAIITSPYYTTKDGFEVQLRINYLGPFVFTSLILP